MLEKLHHWWQAPKIEAARQADLQRKRDTVEQARQRLAKAVAGREAEINALFYGAIPKKEAPK